MIYRLLATLLCFLSMNTAIAVTQVDITGSNIAPIPIAIAQLNNGMLGADSHYKNIESVIINDLESSGLFRVVNKDAYIDNINNMELTPSFASWRQINASNLVVLDVKKHGGGVTATFKIWDIYSEKFLVGKSLDSSVPHWRRLAHKVADQIYERLTGETGYFDTKIAYVSVQAGRGREKARRVMIMDQDGDNKRPLTSGNEGIIMSPRLSPDARSIVYLSYGNSKKPKLKKIDIASGQISYIGEFPGAPCAFRYTSGGSIGLLAVERKGISNIYRIMLSDNSVHQITHCDSICTSPSSSPDGKRIVFNSDMGGKRHLYVMDASGDGVKRISFGDGYYSNPVWSPKGNLIAFTKMVPGKGFFIGFMRPDGSGERVVANGKLVEGPAWAPNGRVIIFERLVREGDNLVTKLHKIDITGYNETQMEMQTEAIDPHWSNLLN